ncbi:MAG TPA: DUF4102 domain-containing protein [Rhodospirillales bacterium]|nr:DUF4102 domain-containing protein [Rhodospirillales bacterium]
MPRPASSTIRLTARTARELPGPPEGKREVTWWCRDLPPFGLRVLNTGRRSWVVRYRIGRRQRFITLGSTEELSADAARKRAAEIVAKARLGEDVRAEIAARRERAAATFGAIVEVFLEERGRELRPRTLVEYRRCLAVYLTSWHRLPVTELNRTIIARRLAAIAKDRGTVAAARCRAYLSACLTWAIRRGLADLEGNPVALTWAPASAPPRDRVLALDELGAIWRATDPARGDHACIVRLLILTGCRREEVGGMKWEELDLSHRLWTLPAVRSKNRRPHAVPLSPPAIAILESRPRRLRREHVFGAGRSGFSGWSRSKAVLDRRIAEMLGKPLVPWRLHDIRRSVVTHLHELGLAEPHVVEAIVNHVSGHKAGIAGVYNLATYETEKRRALDAWADAVRRAAEGSAASLRAVS